MTRTQSIAVNKIIQLLPSLTVDDFKEEGVKPLTINFRFNWWLKTIVELRDAKTSDAQIEICKTLYSQLDDVKGLIRFTLEDYLTIAIKGLFVSKRNIA